MRLQQQVEIRKLNFCPGAQGEEHDLRANPGECYERANKAQADEDFELPKGFQKHLFMMLSFIFYSIYFDWPLCYECPITNKHILMFSPDCLNLIALTSVASVQRTGIQTL